MRYRFSFDMPMAAVVAFWAIIFILSAWGGSICDRISAQLLYLHPRSVVPTKRWGSGPHLPAVRPAASKKD